MDIKETGKKLKPFAPVLSVALVTACVAGSLSGYEAPVYAATQEETPVKKAEKDTYDMSKEAMGIIKSIGHNEYLEELINMLIHRNK